MSGILSVRDAASRLRVRPRQITSAFYDGLLRDDIAPIVGGRRIIPESYLETIAMVLRRRGVEVPTAGRAPAR